MATVMYCDQFGQLLRTVPHELDNSKYATSLNNKFDISCDLTLFKEATRLIGRIQTAANTVYNDLIGIDERCRFISNAIVQRNRSLAEGVAGDLMKLRDLFKVDGEEEECHAYYATIDKFIGEVSGGLKGNAIDEEKSLQKESRFMDEDFGNHLENIVHSMLMSLQKLYKTYKSQPKKVEENEETEKTIDNEDDDVKLLDSHLREQICGELNNSFELLNLRAILKQLQLAMDDVYEMGATEQTKSKISKLVSLLPLLEQFGLLVEYFVIQEAGAHSVSVRMLNVMLNVFIELVQHGFCVPKDLLGDEEKEKEQGGERSADGMGLEDGTGEKDVSDKIENEDQLQDAKRPEEYDKEKGDEENKEEKGIEMSDDFDANLQDIEKKPDDEQNSDEEKEDEDEDPDKQMGETEEGAEKLDDQIWGDEEKGE